MKAIFAVVFGAIGVATTYGCAVQSGEPAADTNEGVCSGPTCGAPPPGPDAGPAVNFKGQFVEAAGTTSIYYVTNGSRHLVPDSTTLGAITDYGEVFLYKPAASVVGEIPIGAPIPEKDLADYFIWSSSSGAYYFSLNDELYPLPDLTTGTAWGGNVNAIRALPAQGARLHTRDAPHPLPSVLPFQVYQQDQISGDYHYLMTTNVTVSANGVISGQTEIQSTYGVWGFTGGMQVALADGSGNPIWSSPIEQWGVNPNSTRTVPWSFQVAESTLNAAKSVVITQVRDEKNTVLTWFENNVASGVLQWSECELLQLVEGLFGGTSNSTCQFGTQTASTASSPAACVMGTDPSCQQCNVGSPGCSASGTCDPNTSPSCNATCNGNVQPCPGPQ